MNVPALSNLTNKKRVKKAFNVKQSELEKVNDQQIYEKFEKVKVEHQKMHKSQKELQNDVTKKKNIVRLEVDLSYAKSEDEQCFSGREKEI